MIPSASSNVYHAAVTLDAQLRRVKMVCQSISDNEPVNHIINAYQELTIAINYIEALIASGIDLTKVGDAIALQFGNDSYSSYASSFNSLRTTLIPNFLTKVKTNETMVFAAVSFDQSTGTLVYGNLLSAARASILTDVTAILDEFS